MIDIHHANSVEFLKTLPDNSVDALVTDPPAAIGFMSKKWDVFQNRSEFVSFLHGIMSECLRIMKPGTYGLVWALPRTAHWTATAIEDAGFEIRDKVLHLFGTGFPKGKAALKPAYEEWWLIRKPAKLVAPFPGLDDCRIAAGPDHAQNCNRKEVECYWRLNDSKRLSVEAHPNGRWPANLTLSCTDQCRRVGTKQVKSGTAVQRNRDGGVHNQIYGKFNKLPEDDVSYADADGNETVDNWECPEYCPIRMLDEQSGECGNGWKRNYGEEDYLGRQYGGGVFGGGGYKGGSTYADSGGASRFFYIAKASRSDRGEGNNHPTVKNTKLMQWLVRLITPKGGVVLDPFFGSGSTGVACVREGFSCIGIENEAQYVEIARRRVVEAQEQMGLLGT